MYRSLADAIRDAEQQGITLARLALDTEAKDQGRAVDDIRAALQRALDVMRGAVEHSWWHIAVGVLIGLLYGWQIFGVLPGEEGVSWQGHLCGFIGGLVAAVLFRRRRPPRAETLAIGTDAA